MKKLILLICLSVFSICTLNAQIKLDRSDISYAPASFSLASDTTFTLPANFEQSGGNKSWDFSGLKAHEVHTTRFLSPDAQNGGSNYPDCNLVIQADGQADVFDYVKANDQAILVLANTADSFISELSRFNLLQFPLSYGDGWTDTNAATFVYTGSDFGAPVDSIKVVVNVSIDNNCDAWGKLKLPLGEKDVLRMRTYIEIDVKVYALNGPSGWMLIQDNLQQEESFTFYAKKAGYWILSVTNDDNGGNNYGFRNESLVSVSNQAMLEIPRFYPNPAHNEISIDIKEPIVLKIYSLSGQLIRERHFETINTNSMDLNGVEPGAYILIFTNEQGQTGQSKLIVQ